MTMRKFSALSLLITGVAGCGNGSVGGDDGLGVSREAVQLCGQFDTFNVNNKEYVVNNNNWGNKGPQCIDANGAGFTVTQASFNNATNGAPASYPSIFKGCHWGNCTTNSGMPVQVSSIGTATSSFSTTLTTNQAYDVAYDIWFNQSPTTNGQPNGAELMVWINRGTGNGTPQPDGSPVATVTIGGATWQVWKGSMTGSGVTWPYIAYLRQPGTTAVSGLDIKAFTNDAVSRGYINRSWYLVSIEAGFEIWQGGTGLQVNSFSASVSSGTNNGGSTGSSTGTTGSTTGTATTGSTGSSAGSTGASTGSTGSTTGSTTGTRTSTTGSGSSGSTSGADAGAAGAPCSNPITVSGGQSGNFNTTGPICLRTADTIHGWGCSNFDGRSVQINNGTAVTQCGGMPIAAKWPDGFNYFAVTAGSFPWASIYWW